VTSHHNRRLPSFPLLWWGLLWAVEFCWWYVPSFRAPKVVIATQDKAPLTPITKLIKTDKLSKGVRVCQSSLYLNGSCGIIACPGVFLQSSESCKRTKPTCREFRVSALLYSLHGSFQCCWGDCSHQWHLQGPQVPFSGTQEM
jgi:hypothetical protein